MLDTSTRLLKLLALLQTRRDWPGAEIADRLGVTTRTVRRDVQRLRQLGYPVQATQGTAGYQLGAGASMPLLQLDDDEAVAVAIGLRTAAGGSVTGIEETSLRALIKLEQLLPTPATPPGDHTAHGNHPSRRWQTDGRSGHTDGRRRGVPPPRTATPRLHQPPQR